MIQEIEEKIKDFIGNHVIINQGGFLESKYWIEKLSYFIEDEILNITDEESDNYLKINLNQIYKTENKEKGIKLFLDNDTTLLLSI